MMVGFEALCGLPCCGGALDGTFMAMKKSSDFGDTYFCSKTFIGVSLSEPHTYVKYSWLVCIYIYIYIYIYRQAVFRVPYIYIYIYIYTMVIAQP